MSDSLTLSVSPTADVQERLNVLIGTGTRI